MIECKWSFDDVATVLDPDAGNHADLPALFAATHRPVPGERSVAGASDTPLEDASVDAYAALTADADGSWPVIIPVLGEPGTGKSHLVRWVWNEFRRDADPRYAVVYIPRIRMNIAGVMERLLDAALHDPDEGVRTAARELVDTARATYQDRDPDRVARELRAEVILQLKRVAVRRIEASALPGKTSAVQLENAVDALETILDEGAKFRRYLHSSDSAIGRRVSVLVEGRPETALHEAPMGFTEDEIREYSPRAAGQSQEFQVAVRRAIVKEEWCSRELLVQLLNDALDRAVSELLAKGTQGRGLTFTEVFRQLRESLHRAGRELVIFVEELKLLGGVERELLESFLDNTEAVGLDPICRVRSIIACTTGEWTNLSQDIGTLTSRLNAWRSPQYVLDGGAAMTLPEIEERLVDMAAHYLNAARVGIPALEAAFRDRPDGTDWVPPNACDSCAVRERCHATFGTGGLDGATYGLFPLNLRALTRAQENAQLQQIQTSLADGFNPRVLLTGVLAPVLKHLVADGEDFPSIALARELNFPPASEATLVQALEVQGIERDAASRTAVLLEAWGNATRVEDEQQLTEYSVSSEIAEMPGLDAVPPVRVRPVASSELKPRRGPEPAIEEIDPGLTAAVDRWRNGTDLVSSERRDLRNRIHELSLRYVDWNDVGGVTPRRSPEFARETGLGDPERLFFFEETTPTQTPPAEGVHVEFARSDDAYIFLRAVASSGTTAPGPDELIILGEGLHKLSTEFAVGLVERGMGRGRALAADHPGLAALAIASLAHGLDPGSPDLAVAPELIAGLVAPTPAVPATSPVRETTDLFDVLRDGVRVPRDDVLFRGQERLVREDVRKWLLRRVGFRRSTWAGEDDQVQMLDAVAVYDAVLNYSSSPRISPLGARKADPDRGESAAMTALATTVFGKIAGSLDREVARSREALNSVSTRVGHDKGELTPKTLTEAVDAAAAAADDADVLIRDESMTPPGEVRASYRRAADAFAQVRSSIDTATEARLLIDLARTDTQAPTRAIAARLYQDYGPCNAYRQTVEGLLARAETYLEYLVAYIPRHYQTTSDPVMESFPTEYPSLLAQFGEALDRLRHRQERQR